LFIVLGGTLAAVMGVRSALAVAAVILIASAGLLPWRQMMD